MFEVTIRCEGENDALRSVITMLDNTLPYMMDNVVITSRDLLSHDDDDIAEANAVHCPNCGPAGCLCDWSEKRQPLNPRSPYPVY